MKITEYFSREMGAAPELPGAAVLRMAGSDLLHEDFCVTTVVVECLFTHWQITQIGLYKTPLPEPVSGLGGQYEKLIYPSLLRFPFHIRQQPITPITAPIVGMYRHTGQFGHRLLGIGEECGTRNRHAIPLH